MPTHELLSDNTQIVATSPALPISMPHTRSRYSGSPVTSSTRPSPVPSRLLACEAVPAEEPGLRTKLTRVLEATLNGPWVTGSRRQADPRPQPHEVNNDVTGGTTGHFHAGTASRAAASGLT
jgi:hypothetical protein